MKLVLTNPKHKKNLNTKPKTPLNVKYSQLRNFKKKIVKKNVFKKKSEFFPIIYLLEGKKAIFLILPFNEISIGPELSSPPNFRIHFFFLGGGVL